MTSNEDQRAELDRLLNEWLVASDKADRIRRQYFWLSDFKPGEPIQWPEKAITPEANREMQEAEDAEKEAHRAYLDARKRHWQRTRV